MSIGRSPLVFVVAGVLRAATGAVLVQRRPAGKSMPGLWEFPGGKVDPGETPEAALIRELNEELGIRVVADDLQSLTFASAPIDDGHLVMLLYAVARWRGEPEARHAEALFWASLDDLATLEMPPADRPLVTFLKAMPTL